MLEHQKEILDSVSGNPELFRTEIIKSFRWLKSYEILELHQWLKSKHYNSHKTLIKDIFQFIAA